MHYLDEQAKAARLDSLYRRKSKACENAETKLRAAEKNADKFKAEAVEMGDKYRTLLDAVEKLREKQQRPKVDVSKKAGELSVSYYKDLVRDKDKEILTLLKRIKLLSAADLKSRLNTRHSEAERQQLSERIAELTFQLDRVSAEQREAASLQHLAASTTILGDAGPGPGEGEGEDEALGAGLQRMASRSSLKSIKSDDELSDVPDDDEDADDMAAAGDALSLDNEPQRTQPTTQLGNDLALSRHAPGGGGGSGGSGGLVPGGGIRRPASALSRRSQGTHGNGSGSRPQSAKRVSLAQALEDMVASDNQGQGAMIAQGALSKPMQVGPKELGRIQELERDNKRMSLQLKQLKNAMAVSHGAADAYRAVVAKLQEVEGGAQQAEEAAERPHEALALEDSERGGGGESKWAAGKRGQIAKARLNGGHVAINGGPAGGHITRPPRPSSAPPGRQPLPQSRPSSATPGGGGGAGAGGLGVQGQGVRGAGGLSDLKDRPTSAMHRRPGSRPTSALSRGA